MPSYFTLPWSSRPLTVSELESAIRRLERDHQKLREEADFAQERLQEIAREKHTVQHELDSKADSWKTLCELYEDHHHIELEDDYFRMKQQMHRLRSELARIDEETALRDRILRETWADEDKIRNRLDLAQQAYEQYLDRREEQRRRRGDAPRDEQHRYRDERPSSQPRSEPRRTHRAPQAPRPALPPPPPNQTIADWYKVVNVCFADYTRIIMFPAPPAWTCGNETCKSQARDIAACPCNIRYVFERVPDLNLKKERLRWHPDRFAVCREDKRDDFQNQAKEVFQVLDRMFKGDEE